MSIALQGQAAEVSIGIVVTKRDGTTETATLVGYVTPNEDAIITPSVNGDNEHGDES